MLVGRAVAALRAKATMRPRLASSSSEVGGSCGQVVERAEVGDPGSVLAKGVRGRFATH